MSCVTCNLEYIYIFFLNLFNIVFWDKLVELASGLSWWLLYIQGFLLHATAVLSAECLLIQAKAVAGY